MITNSLNLKMDYENTRMGRYAHVKKRVIHTAGEISVAYWAWVDAPYGREHLWDAYCDARDSVPCGTNAKIRRDRAQRNWVC